MITWVSWRWHLFAYHGHREFWLFGVPEEESEKFHRACFKWCHKPERDRPAEPYLTVDQIRESLGLNEPG